MRQWEAHDESHTTHKQDKITKTNLKCTNKGRWIQGSSHRWSRDQQTWDLLSWRGHGICFFFFQGAEIEQLMNLASSKVGRLQKTCWRTSKFLCPETTVCFHCFPLIVIFYCCICSYWVYGRVGAGHFLIFILYITITLVISGHEEKTVHCVETLLVLCLWTMPSNTDFTPKLIP